MVDAAALRVLTTQLMLLHYARVHVLSVAASPLTAADGAKCDLRACECAGVDLSYLKGKTYAAPQDAEGYGYLLAICGEIPKASLPSGCQQYAEHPSVVKVSTAHMRSCTCVWDLFTLIPWRQFPQTATGKTWIAISLLPFHFIMYAAHAQHSRP